MTLSLKVKRSIVHHKPIWYLLWTWIIAFKNKWESVWNIIWVWDTIFIWPKIMRTQTRLMYFCDIKDTTFLSPTQFSAVICEVLSSSHRRLVLFSFRSCYVAEASPVLLLCTCQWHKHNTSKQMLCNFFFL